jgi:hypothetical protein
MITPISAAKTPLELSEVALRLAVALLERYRVDAAGMCPIEQPFT